MTGAITFRFVLLDTVRRRQAVLRPGILRLRGLRQLDVRVLPQRALPP